MQHILVSVDGSEWSQVAARYALDFARSEESPIVALAVLPREVITALDESPDTLAYSSKIPEAEQLARRAVNEWFASTEGLCEQAGLCFNRAIDVGGPAERLLWNAITARLCVLGAHGANAPAHTRAGLGRTAATLLRSCVKPMLVTREIYKPISKVIVGWDGHPDAAHAAEMIFGPAKQGNWQVYVVSGAETTSSLAQSCTYLAEEMVREGVDAQAFIKPGNAPDIIFRAMEKFDADLVALGGRQKSTTHRLMRGGAWWDLVEQLPVPVLLYR